MLLGPFMGGNVVEFLLGMTGSKAVAYSEMWLVMLVPIACALIVVIYWNVKMKD
jgi:hypothetical protein